MRTASRRRSALFALFFVPGLSISSWVTRTPDIRDLLGASTAEIGLVLLGLSVGSMVGILSAGPLVARFSTRPMMVLGTTLIVLSMPTIGIGASSGQSGIVTAGLLLFGLGMGGLEVALNVEGADVEKALDRPVLPALHGSFSLGTFIGAVAGIIFTATEYPVLHHLLIVSGIDLLILVVAIREISSRVGTAEHAAGTSGAAPGGGMRALLRDGRLLIIGAVVLAMALAEGTANDWLPLVMVDGHGFDAALGSAIYAVFAASMTVGRFSGGWFIARYGRAAVLCASAIAGAAGLAVVIFVDNQVAAGAAVVLWGLGASLGFPVALSAAGASGPHSAARVSLVATLGYIAFLVGPPVLGFLGEHFGLRSALIVPLALVAAAAFLAPHIAQRQRRLQESSTR
ncbi:fucose permease [Microbacterium foliorum]|uniref:MFS transporter n=1 Tax=Microbacterium foliorum TaxID=104336 RepID=UPI0020A158AE|nr:MFS transporter [Microbacterium foliorum]MCP1428996.1 fucose permease [Microbacterium foliorum]